MGDLPGSKGVRQQFPLPDKNLTEGSTVGLSGCETGFWPEHRHELFLHPCPTQDKKSYIRPFIGLEPTYVFIVLIEGKDYTGGIKKK